MYFFFNDPATTEIYALSLHDALPICVCVVVLGFLYSGYKVFGQAVDDRQTDWPALGSVLPRTDDLNMPPILEILGEFAVTPGGTDQMLGRQLFDEALFTLREATVGFIAGIVVGLGIAIALARSRRLERGVFPYVIASQTIPLIAIAPVVVVWGRKNLDFLPWEWQDWMSVFSPYFRWLAGWWRCFCCAQPFASRLNPSESWCCRSPRWRWCWARSAISTTTSPIRWTAD